MKVSFQSMKMRLNKPSISLSYLHILNDGWLASLPLLLPFIQKDLNFSFSRIGLLTSILSLASVALAIPSASISKKYGGYKVLVFAVLLYSIAFTITGLAKSFIYIIIAFTIGSMGFGIFHPISFALIAHSSNKNELGRKMGSFTAIGDIGRIGISALVTLLVSLVSWRNTALLYSIIPIILVVGLIVLTKNNGLWNEKGIQSENVHGLHCNVKYILAIISSFIDSFASSSLFVFIPFLYILRGASTALLGSLSGAFFIGNMLGKIISGKITDVFGSNKIFIISELIMASLLIGLSVTESIPLMAIVSVLLGAVTKGTVPVLNTIIVNSVTDKRLIDKAFGVGSFVNGIASVIAPLLFGIITDKYGIVLVFKTSACFAVVATIPLIILNISNKRSQETT